MIDTIIFDIGNVLVHFRWKEFLHEFEFSEEAEQLISDKIFCGNIWCEFDRGAENDEEIIKKCCELVPKYENEVKEIFANIGQVAAEFDYAKEWILNLKSRGYKVYLLSNYGKTSFEESGFTFLEDVDGRVVSYEIKAIKPEPAIFEEIIRKYSIVPKNTVFFDDILENVEAARTHGLHAIQFISREQAEKDLESVISML